MGEIRSNYVYNERGVACPIELFHLFVSIVGLNQQLQFLLTHSSSESLPNDGQHIPDI